MNNKHITDADCKKAKELIKIIDIGKTQNTLEFPDHASGFPIVKMVPIDNFIGIYKRLDFKFKHHLLIAFFDSFEKSIIRYRSRVMMLMTIENKLSVFPNETKQLSYENFKKEATELDLLARESFKELKQLTDLLIELEII